MPNIFDKVKDYLSTPPILIPPILGKPLILYLTVHERSMDCILGQHDKTRKKEHDIYYLVKNSRNMNPSTPSGKDMLHTTLDRSKTQTILVIPYYVVDFKIGSHQVYF